MRELTLSANQHAHAAHKRLVFSTGDDIGVAAAAAAEPLAECDDGDDGVQPCTGTPLHITLHPMEVGLEAGNPGGRGLCWRDPAACTPAELAGWLARAAAGKRAGCVGQPGLRSRSGSLATILVFQGQFLLRLAP